MKALITGMGGFVASHLASELDAFGHEVWGAGRIVATHPALMGGYSQVVDLTQPEQTRELLESVQPDVVFHLAAQSNPATSWANFRATFESNVFATIETVTASGRLAVPPRFIYISSSDVYGVPQEAHMPLGETAPPKPANPYAVSKLAAEQCATLYGNRAGVEVITLRPFSHTGPGQSASFVVPAFASQIAQIETGRMLVLAHGDLHNYRDFTDVRDVVRAYRLVAEAEKPASLYNICAGRSVMIENILTQLCEMSSSIIRTRCDETRARHENPARVRGDGSLIFNDLGWKPVIPLAETLKAVLEEQRMLTRCTEQAL